MTEGEHLSNLDNTAPAPCSSPVDLTALIPIETLQGLQDRLAELGRVTVCICSVEGELITKPSWGTGFSKMLATSPKGSDLFRKNLRTLARDISEDVEVFRHGAMTIHASPIEHEAALLALLVVGVRLTSIPGEADLRSLAGGCGLRPEKLLDAARRVPPFSAARSLATYRFADVLAETVGTLYAQAVRIENQYADLQTIHGLASLLAGTHDLQEILDHTVTRIVEVLRVKACSVRLLDEDSGELVVKAVCNLSKEYLEREASKLGENAIDASAFEGETVYIEDARVDPRSPHHENARREGIVSGLCVPMSYRGKTIGLVRVYADRRCTFDTADTALLRSIGSQTASALIHSRLWESQIQAERFNEQVRRTGDIQRRMIPASPPEHPFLTFGCVYRPTIEVGGDFYDFIELPKGNLGVCVSDVVGKGLPAAMLMASVRSALRAHAHSIFNLDEIIAQVNRNMCRDTQTSEFATLFYGIFSSSTSRLTYCDAGHLPPLLLRDQHFIDLDAGGMVIGVDPEQTYDRGILHLQSGDVIVLVTDGVTEAMDFHSQVFGSDRLKGSIIKHRNLDAQQLADQILWDVRRFAGLADQSDDITVVTIKVGDTLPEQNT